MMKERCLQQHKLSYYRVQVKMKYKEIGSEVYIPLRLDCKHTYCNHSGSYFQCVEEVMCLLICTLITEYYYYTDYKSLNGSEQNNSNHQSGSLLTAG